MLRVGRGIRVRQGPGGDRRHQKGRPRSLLHALGGPPRQFGVRSVAGSSGTGARRQPGRHIGPHVIAAVGRLVEDQYLGGVGRQGGEEIAAIQLGADRSAPGGDQHAHAGHPRQGREDIAGQDRRLALQGLVQRVNRQAELPAPGRLEQRCRRVDIAAQALADLCNDLARRLVVAPQHRIKRIQRRQGVGGQPGGVAGAGAERRIAQHGHPRQQRRFATTGRPGDHHHATGLGIARSGGEPGGDAPQLQLATTEECPDLAPGDTPCGWIEVGCQLFVGHQCPQASRGKVRVGDQLGRAGPPHLALGHLRGRDVAQLLVDAPHQLVDVDPGPGGPCPLLAVDDLDEGARKAAVQRRIAAKGAAQNHLRPGPVGLARVAIVRRILGSPLDLAGQLAGDARVDDHQHVVGTKLPQHGAERLRLQRSTRQAALGRVAAEQVGPPRFVFAMAGDVDHHHIIGRALLKPLAQARLHGLPGWVAAQLRQRALMGMARVVLEPARHGVHIGRHFRQTQLRQIVFADADADDIAAHRFTGGHWQSPFPWRRR